MLFLAMTTGEMERCTKLPSHIAYFACQLSSRNPGLSNLPAQLPPKSMLIITDQIPISHHDPQKILHQVGQLVEQFSPVGILLDFCRQGGEGVVGALANLSCPVGVSQQYAHLTTGPVFLSPAPLCRPLERIVKPWQGRIIWLDTPVCNQTVTVTPEGAAISEFYPYSPLKSSVLHQNLGIQYTISQENEQITYTLSRSPNNLTPWIIHAQKHGIEHQFCFYREFYEKSS